MGVRTNKTNINLINRDKSFSLTIIKGAHLASATSAQGRFGAQICPGFLQYLQISPPCPICHCLSLLVLMGAPEYNKSKGLRKQPENYITFIRSCVLL